MKGKGFAERGMKGVVFTTIRGYRRNGDVTKDRRRIAVEYRLNEGVCGVG